MSTYPPKNGNVNNNSGRKSKKKQHKSYTHDDHPGFYPDEWARLESRITNIEHTARNLKQQLSSPSATSTLEKQLESAQVDVGTVLAEHDRELSALREQFSGNLGPAGGLFAPQGLADAFAPVFDMQALAPTSPILQSDTLACHEEFSMSAGETYTVWANPTSSCPGIVFDTTDETNPKFVRHFAARRDISTATSSYEVLLSTLSIEPSGVSATNSALRGVVEAAVLSSATPTLTFTSESPLVHPKSGELWRGNSSVVNAPLASGVQLMLPSIAVSQSPGPRPTQSAPGSTKIRDNVCFKEWNTGFSGTGLDSTVLNDMTWSVILTGTVEIKTSISHHCDKPGGGTGDVRWRVVGKFITSAGKVEETLYTMSMDTVTDNDEITMTGSRIIEVCQRSGSHTNSLLYGVKIVHEASSSAMDYANTSSGVTTTVEYCDVSATADNVQLIATISDCDTGFHLAEIEAVEFPRDMDNEWSTNDFKKLFIPRTTYITGFHDMFMASGELQFVVSGSSVGQPGAFSLRSAYKAARKFGKKAWRSAKKHLGNEMEEAALEAFDTMSAALPLHAKFVSKIARPLVSRTAHKILNTNASKEEKRGAILALEGLSPEEQSSFIKTNAPQLRQAVKADPELLGILKEQVEATQPRGIIERFIPSFAKAAAFQLTGNEAGLRM